MSFKRSYRTNVSKCLCTLVFLFFSFDQILTISSMSLDKKQLNKFQNFYSIRSPADRKIYHIYKMSNGLEVLIVKDKNARKTAAGITVNSGITKEGEVYGLAHFTEHMLFLGSKKYPNPTKFVDYITQYSGVFNGYTDFDITAFYFSIHPDYFKKGIDIFARFFIDPLFDKQYIKKEVNSVNSEFERNIQVDYKRKEQVFRDIANKNSHFHRFTTGNNKTLLEYTEKEGLNLRDEVSDYYQKNYRPDNMKLIIYGNEDVDYYKDIVEKSFSEMKAHDEPYEEKDTSELPFTFFNEGKFVIYKTISQHQQLEINFLIPDIFESLPHNIGLYFKTLFNYKGRGSLVDILIKNGLGSYIYSGLRKTYKGWSIFKIRASLTEKGIIQIPRILFLIFKYIEYIKKLSLNKKLFYHIKRFYDIKFLFINRYHRPISFVSSMCMAFLKYSKKDLFSQHNLLYLYDSMKIREFANHFKLKNSIILLGNRKFNNKLTKNFKYMIKQYKYNKDFKSEDPWYNTKYTKYSISDKFIDEVENDTQHPEELGFSRHFNFLRRRRRIRNISLLKTCKRNRKQCIKEFRKDRKDLTPKKIWKSKYYELWSKRDRSFMVSRINFFTKFIFKPDDLIKDPKYSILLKLHTYSIQNQLRNYINDQRRNRNYFYILPKINGFTVKLYSFTQIIQEAAQEFFEIFKNIEISKNSFILVKDQLKKYILRRLNLSPRFRAYLNFYNLVLKDFIRNQKLLNALKEIKYEDLIKFSKKLYRKMYIKSFIHGDTNKEFSKRLFEKSISKNFKDFKQIKQKERTYRNQHADLKGYHIFREKLPNKYNINHAILNFYQIGKSNLKNIILSYLVKFLCGNIYFTQLRIKEQLGYVTQGRVFSSGGNIYYLIIIQGSKKTPDKMDISIGNLVNLMRKRLLSVKEKKFDKFLQLISRRIRRDRSMNRRTNRLWNELITERRYFNIKGKVKKIVAKLKKKNLLEFFNKVFKGKLKKLSIQEFSNKVKKVPKKVGKVRGYRGKLISNKDFFRNRNKFI